MNGPPPRRRVLRASGLSVALLCGGLVSGLTGCSTPSEPARSTAAEADAEAARIADALRSAPGVVSAKVWTLGLKGSDVDPATIAMEIAVSTPADRSRVSDEAIRLAWTSRIRPLQRITISTGDVRPVDVSTSDAATIKDLTAKYGPRPS